MATSIDQTAFNLGLATLLGACIGFERQWRQRMAGLRTNMLVAIGAASIFREGLRVSGLNTAATLWCSAAMGLLASSGHPRHTAAAAAFVVLINLTLQPQVRLISQQPLARTEADFCCSVRIVCRSPEEAHIRELLLQGTGSGHLSLRQLGSTDLEEGRRLEVDAKLTSPIKSDAVLEQVVGRINLEPTVSTASRSVGPNLEQAGLQLRKSDGLSDPGRPINPSSRRPNVKASEPRQHA